MKYAFYLLLFFTFISDKLYSATEESERNDIDIPFQFICKNDGENRIFRIAELVDPNNKLLEGEMINQGNGTLSCKIKNYNVKIKYTSFTPYGLHMCGSAPYREIDFSINDKLIFTGQKFPTSCFGSAINKIEIRDSDEKIKFCGKSIVTQRYFEFDGCISIKTTDLLKIPHTMNSHNDEALYSLIEFGSRSDETLKANAETEAEIESFLKTNKFNPENDARSAFQSGDTDFYISNTYSKTQTVVPGLNGFESCIIQNYANENSSPFIPMYKYQDIDILHSDIIRDLRVSKIFYEDRYNREKAKLLKGEKCF